METNRQVEVARKRITRVTVTTAFLTTFMSSALNLSIPNISAEFNVGAGTVGWVVTIYTLTVAAFCVPLGKLADITGKARMLKLGLGGFGVLTFLCMMVNNIQLLLILRALQGIFAAMIFATNNPIIIEAYPPNQRGRALGLSTAATYMGLSAGPVIGGIINHNLGWHYIFIFSGILAVAALILAMKGTTDDKPEKMADKSSLDYIGTILYVPMIFMLLYGISLVGSSKLAYGLIILSLLLGAVFVKNEFKQELPIIKIGMFVHDRELGLSNLAALLNYGATFAISYLISIYLQVALGFSSQMAGIILVTMPVMQAAFSPSMGKLSDRIVPYKLATSGMICCIVTLILFIVTMQQYSVAFVVIALAIGGIGFALFSSPNTNAINARLGVQDRAMGNSVLATMRTVGQSLSMCIVTVIVNLRLGNVPLQEASNTVLINTIRICFAVFVVLCVAGTIMSAARNRK